MSRRSRSATDRVARMLSIVPWIAARDGPRLDDICAQFDMERSRLLDDLKVLQFVGLPPYSPDMLTEVTFSGDRVWVRLPDIFSRPLRLTPDQALALVAAGAAASAAQRATSGRSGTDPGSDPGPLATGVAKLAALLQIEVDEAVGVRLGRSDPVVLELLRDAVTNQQQIHLDYFSFSRDERRERTVDPYRVFSEAGAWYLYGHCHRAGAPRLFRVDRIFGADLPGSRFERGPEADVVPPVFGPAPDAPRVTLALAPEASWVVSQYPVESSLSDPSSSDSSLSDPSLSDPGSETGPGGHDGRQLVVLAVASRAWLEKLLLRLGDAAEVVDSTDRSLMGVRRDAAARVLARYR